MYDMTMNIGVPTAAPAPANSLVQFVLSPAMSTVWPVSTLQSNGVSTTDKAGNTIYYRQWYNGAPTGAQIFSLTAGTRFLIGTWVFSDPTLPPPSAVATMYDNADGGNSGFTQQSFSIVGLGDRLPHTTNPFVQNTTAIAPNVGSNAPGSTSTSTLGASTPNDYTLGLAGTVALPVKLVSFAATKVGNTTAELKWVTASEQDINYFEVERSADARSFTSIATRVKADNKATGSTYTINDTNPLDGVNYYRLKMVDFSDAKDYSSLQQLRFGNAKLYTLSPNPASDRIVVTGTAAGQKVKILSVSGQLVAEYPATGSSVQMNVSALVPGIYHVQVTEGDVLVFSTKLTKD